MSQSSMSPSFLGSPVSPPQLRHLLMGLDTKIDFKTLKDDTSFADGGADSLDIFNLVVAVEDAYRVRIPSGHLNQVSSLNDMAKYLNDRLP